MVQHLIVPVDGSEQSWNAFDVATGLGGRLGADVRVVEVVFASRDVELTKVRLDNELQRRTKVGTGADIDIEVRLTADTVAAELAVLLELHPGSVLVMSSHGRGRSAALAGSVTEDVLEQTFGPILLVGPKAEADDFCGPVVVTVDGSDESEAALPLAAAWAAELGTTPWVVNVTARPGQPTGNVLDTTSPRQLAQRLQRRSGHAVEFDEVHGGHPAVAVAGYAQRLGASMIVASSHGRSGLSRLTMGSVTSGFVRHATCPVLVIRLPHPTQAPADVAGWAWAF